MAEIAFHHLLVEAEALISGREPLSEDEEAAATEPLPPPMLPGNHESTVGGGGLHCCVRDLSRAASGVPLPPPMLPGNHESPVGGWMAGASVVVLGSPGVSTRGQQRFCHTRHKQTICWCLQ